ncbi:hypothetical protein SAMN05216215_102168 [Saccharopolyspora shandongensis]|uniref:Uncharacterized protein n=1 Tax=Saccharopolyspora shandongensis TaxID=418495 RepID=A0A1H3HTN1_9PSEU|nr:hypothetical protein [Saccharopolyspora shandongensis]SDY18138.1 hypothetical protein SAMN05216215_102168 [Saccharopolyspora shandongensis]
MGRTRAFTYYEDNLLASERLVGTLASHNAGGVSTDVVFNAFGELVSVPPQLAHSWAEASSFLAIFANPWLLGAPPPS